MYGAHVGLAVVFLAGIAAAAIFNVQALRASQPSRIARAFARVRPVALVVTLALLALLVTGLALVDERGYSYGDGWIVAALVLWVAANALGGAGGKRDRETRRLAERLEAEGDHPSEELRARVRDPASLVPSYGAGLAGIAILVLMLTRP
jgi:uncharacterized membrane protein